MQYYVHKQCNKIKACCSYNIAMIKLVVHWSEFRQSSSNGGTLIVLHKIFGKTECDSTYLDMTSN